MPGTRADKIRLLHCIVSKLYDTDADKLINCLIRIGDNRRLLSLTTSCGLLLLSRRERELELGHQD